MTYVTTKHWLTLTTADQALPGRAEPIRTAETHFVSGRPLKGPYPEGMQQAQFAMGCYWGVERIFWKIPGVWVTAVGNAGGGETVASDLRNLAFRPP